MLRNDALQATIRAERFKEREDNRNAARYVKIRALLDEAERQIYSANINRVLKNKLVAKLFKARKSLDSELDVNEVIDTMAFMVSIINLEMENDVMASENAVYGIKKNLDTDNDLSARSEGKLNKNACVTQKRILSESEQIVIPVVQNVIRNSVPAQKLAKASKRRRKKAQLGDETENESDRDSVISSCSEEFQSINSTLETLSLSLEILQEMPKLILDKTQYTQLVHTVRATKQLLLTEEGCLALLEPFRMLKISIESGSKGVPNEPAFTNALDLMKNVLSNVCAKNS